MDLLLAHKMQWYKEPQFLDPFEHLTFCPASSENQTWAACMDEICLNYWTMLPPPKKNPIYVNNKKQKKSKCMCPKL